MIRFYNYLNPSRLLSLCITGAFAATLLGGTASALQVNPNEAAAVLEKPTSEQSNKKDVKAAPKKLSETRITELHAFAKQHHPEIIPLLDFLAKKRPRKFERVMDGLDRDVSKLEKAKLKSPEAYETGLAGWVNQSRTRLYAAQYKVAADTEAAATLRKKIENLVTERVDSRIAHLERERDAALEKAKRLENTIEGQKSTREATILKRITAVTKNAPNIRKMKKGASDKEKSPKKEKTASPNLTEKPSN